MIVEPGRQAVPSVVLGLNWAHPLTKDLRRAWFFRHGLRRLSLALPEEGVYTLNDVPQNTGTGVRFDGSNDALTLTSASPLGSPPTDVFSLAVVGRYGAIYGTETANSYTLTLGNTGSANPFVAIGQLSAGTFAASLRVRNEALTNVEISGANISDGRRHVILGVNASSTDHKVYVDGTLAASSVTAVSLSASTLNRITFGALGRTGLGNFNAGLLEAAFLWWRALSADEARLLGDDPFVLFRPRPVLWAKVPPVTFGAAVSVPVTVTATLTSLEAQFAAAATAVVTGTGLLTDAATVLLVGALAVAVTVTALVVSQEALFAASVPVAVSVLGVVTSPRPAAHTTIRHISVPTERDYRLGRQPGDIVVEDPRPFAVGGPAPSPPGPPPAPELFTQVPVLVAALGTLESGPGAELLGAAAVAVTTTGTGTLTVPVVATLAADAAVAVTVAPAVLTGPIDVAAAVAVAVTVTGLLTGVAAEFDADAAVAVTPSATLTAVQTTLAATAAVAGTATASLTSSGTQFDATAPVVVTGTATVSGAQATLGAAVAIAVTKTASLTSSAATFAGTAAVAVTPSAALTAAQTTFAATVAVAVTKSGALTSVAAALAAARPVTVTVSATLTAVGVTFAAAPAVRVTLGRISLTSASAVDLLVASVVAAITTASGILLTSAGAKFVAARPVVVTVSATLTAVTSGLGPALFPANAIWNTPIDTAPLHADSHNIADNIFWHGGHNFHADFGTTISNAGILRYNGIPVNVVPGTSQPHKVVTITTYASESDPMPGGGVPIPNTVRIENDPVNPADPPDLNGDRHCLIVDTDTHTLHEFARMERLAGTQYRAVQYSTWDYQSNALRTIDWTSTDAAGLPIANLLVNYDEVQAAVQSGGTVPHAFRFTLELTYTGPPPAYLWPARHNTFSGDVMFPKFGMRFRLKQSFDISAYSPTNRAILRTLKKYGMFLADNGGDWFLSGSPDPRWDDNDLHLLVQLLPSNAIELVDESTWMVNVNSAQAAPPGLAMTDVGTGLNRVVTVEAAGQFRLVFEAADNWGLSQWYDLTFDPGATKNLTGPGCPSGSSFPCTDITTAEPGLFNWVTHQTNPDDCKLYTRSAFYFFPNLARSFTILEASASRVVVEAMSHPCVTAVGTLDNVTGIVRYWIYPDGRIYIRSRMLVTAAQSIVDWYNSIMGLEDPGHMGEIPPDTVGWIRASASQNPYSFVPTTEPYVFAYFVPETTGPFANYAHASILLVPRTGNPSQGGQVIHSWSHFVRWGYGINTFSLPAGGSITQNYLIQLGAQSSTVLPNITSAAVAGPIAAAYQAAPLPT